MGLIAVIDTETTWEDRVMSIGTVIADDAAFRPLAAKYHVLSPEYTQGGMFSNVLFCNGCPTPRICSRADALAELNAWLRAHGVEAMFAYNAGFDKGHLPELGWLRWFDIMGLAAYRQHNPKIPCSADCYATGRLKRGYGVEAIYRMLSGDCGYREVHNALCDALDELQIMAMLGHSPACYTEIKNR